MRRVVGVAALLLSACGSGEPPPAVTGISPGDVAPAAPEPARPLVLEAPAEPSSPPAEATTAPVAVTRTVFEVDPLGRFEVVTWEEAGRRAEARIAAGNLQAEWNRLRAEIQGRRR